MKDKIIIGSRESRLAVIQAEMVQDYLQKTLPQKTIEILTMKTTGDKILNQALERAGGKGLFVKELDHALLEKRSDLSVHSLKDVPTELPEELPLLAFSRREDPRDALILPEGATEIDFSRPVGCSSKRRMVQFQKLYPQAKFETIRGNVQTRLKRLDSGEFSATILAAAGLKRLGLEYRISRYFEPDEMIPAAGQGILAVQGRAGEDYSWLKGYNDRGGEACAKAERAFVCGLGGNCSDPIAAHATVEGETLHLRAFYQNEATGAVYTGSRSGSVRDPEHVGHALAAEFRAKQNGCGKVWLVGAGPSDPGLFTLKGRQVLEDAEVVVYDALVGPGILAMIPDTAETINVGKRSSHHTMRQEQISEVLAEKALEGKRVVRLKGGDPFLFGRGGEELEVLVREGVPYEVVPGVTSAIAVPAYQGIPVTHRDFCSSVHIITGHKREGEAYNIDFEALVRTKGTLVFLMGVSSLGAICDGLLKAGIRPEMPAALLARGTTAAQNRIVATVATLPETVARHGAITPAIIVVGEVCALADEFSWAEKRVLGGVRVFVTRPKELAGTLSLRLRKLGAEVVEIPAIQTKAREGGAFAEALDTVDAFDWIVFTSPTGVRIFFEEMKRKKLDVRRLAKTRFAVIGSGSEKELEKYGFYGDLMPEVYDGEHLGMALAAVCEEELAKKDTEKSLRILIPRAAIGNQELISALAQVSGLEVSDVPTYDTYYGLDTEEETPALDLAAELSSGGRDYVIFTSASTVKGFAAAAAGLDDTKVRAICIGRQTKEAADALGMQTWMSEKASIDSLIDKLMEVSGRKSVLL
ncbi:MAG: uroporphyrinogen-III C-methyltransferase [Lachnospiraceae bacterium]